MDRLPHEAPEGPKVPKDPTEKPVGNIQFSIRALLMVTALVGYFAAKWKEHSDAYKDLARAQAAMKELDPNGYVDFFRSNIEHQDVRCVYFANIDDERLRVFMNEHQRLMNMTYQMIIDDGDLSHETFRRIAELDQLKTLAIGNGGEVTLQELEPLREHAHLERITVRDPEFSEAELRKALPDASCSTTLYSSPVLPKDYFPPPLNQEH